MSVPDPSYLFSHADDVLTVQFTVGAYGPGKVEFSFVSHFEHGVLVNTAVNSEVIDKLEKSLEISTFEPCYDDLDCKTDGFSVLGGQINEITFVGEIPADLKISIVQNGVDLCATDQCSLVWTDTTTTFVTPPSQVYYVT